MKTFQIATLLTLFASAMAFVPQQVTKSEFVEKERLKDEFWSFRFQVAQKRIGASPQVLWLHYRSVQTTSEKRLEDYCVLEPFRLVM